jgi:hypothetical protein
MIALLLAKGAAIERAGAACLATRNFQLWSRIPQPNERILLERATRGRFQWTSSLLSYRFLTWGGLPSA